jgi:hypothetical protein
LIRKTHLATAQHGLVNPVLQRASVCEFGSGMSPSPTGFTEELTTITRTGWLMSRNCSVGFNTITACGIAADPSSGGQSMTQ